MHVHVEGGKGERTLSANDERFRFIFISQSAARGYDLPGIWRIFFKVVPIDHYIGCFLQTCRKSTRVHCTNKITHGYLCTR